MSPSRDGCPDEPPYFRMFSAVSFGLKMMEM